MPAKNSKTSKKFPKKSPEKTPSPASPSPSAEISSDLVLATLNQILSHLQVEAETAIQFDQETGYHHVQIETQEPGLLIGFRGDTLSALQTLLNLFLLNIADQWPRIIVNIGDYRQRREQTLIQLARNAAQRVQFSGEPYTFGPLTPGERRIIHLTLQDHPGVVTYSEGDSPHRRLVVAPK